MTLEDEQQRRIHMIQKAYEDGTFTVDRLKVIANDYLLYLAITQEQFDSLTLILDPPETQTE